MRLQHTIKAVMRLEPIGLSLTRESSGTLQNETTLPSIIPSSLNEPGHEWIGEHMATHVVAWEMKESETINPAIKHIAFYAA